MNILVIDGQGGGITPAMAKAVGQSRAKRILLPLNRCNTIIAGVNDLSIGHLLHCVLDELAQI